MSNIELATQIQQTLETPGWRQIEAMLDSQVKEIKEDFYARIAAHPEQMIGKTAIRLASRAKALEDFKESIFDRIRILAQPVKGGR